MNWRCKPQNIANEVVDTNYNLDRVKKYFSIDACLDTVITSTTVSYTMSVSLLYIIIVAIKSEEW